MNKALKIIVLLGIISISGTLIYSAKKKENTVKNETNSITPIEKNTSEFYEIKALKLPNSMDFAGESVPLNEKDIHERLDRELLVNTYWQSNGLLMLKRANKYFPTIEKILEQNGIPNDFKYLALIESGLQNVTSPSGAKGFWQILKTTGKELNLEVNSNVDERYHIEKSTEAACKYLKKSKNKFGSWTLAASAYNAGNRRISIALEKQRTDNYYDLLLNDETSRYVPRILAVKEIISHPEKYGFIFSEEDLYQPELYYEVKIDTAITDIVKFARDYNMTYKEIKQLNPWLRDPHLNNKSRKEYFIKVKK